MNARNTKGISLSLIALLYIVLSINLHSDLAGFLGISVLAAKYLLVLIGFLGYFVFSWQSEKAFLIGHELQQGNFTHDVLNNKNRFWRESFNTMLAAATLYFVLYLNQHQAWYQGALWVVSGAFCLICVRAFNRFVPTKLNTWLSTLCGLAFMTIMLMVLQQFNTQAGQQDLQFNQFLLLVCLSILAVFLAMVLGSLTSIARGKIWSGVGQFSYEKKLIQNGTGEERAAIYDMDFYFTHIFERLVYFSVLFVPLYFALATLVDIRFITFLWLSAGFLPVCLFFSKYISTLEGSKYFLSLKVTFHYLFWALLIWMAFSQFLFYLYCSLTQWYVESPLLTHGLFPSFLIAYNEPVSKQFLLAQGEGVLYSYIFLIQVVYFWGSLKTQQYRRAALQVVSLLTFLLIVGYNDNIEYAATMIKSEENAFLTPAIIIITLIPMTIDFICQSLRQFNSQHIACPNCRQANTRSYNFCQLCGKSLFGATKKLLRDSNLLMSDLVKQLCEQIKQEKLSPEEAEELIKVTIDGMQGAYDTSRNQINLSHLVSYYQNDLLELLESAKDRALTQNE